MTPTSETQSGSVPLLALAQVSHPAPQAREAQDGKLTHPVERAHRNRPQGTGQAPRGQQRATGQHLGAVSRRASQGTSVLVSAQSNQR